MYPYLATVFAFAVLIFLSVMNLRRTPWPIPVSLIGKLRWAQIGLLIVECVGFTVSVLLWINETSK